MRRQPEGERVRAPGAGNAPGALFSTNGNEAGGKSMRPLLSVVVCIVGGIAALAYISPGDPVGGSRFVPGAGPLGPIIDTLIYGVLAFGALVLGVWALCKTRIQDLAIPHHDELHLIVQKYKAKDRVTEAEARLALACALCGGLRICAILFALALLATQ